MMKRILIVDDMATNRELIREALMCREYSITEAGNDAGQISVSRRHNRFDSHAFVLSCSRVACSGGSATKSEMTRNQKVHEIRV